MKQELHNKLTTWLDKLANTELTYRKSKESILTSIIRELHNHAKSISDAEFNASFNINTESETVSVYAPIVNFDDCRLVIFTKDRKLYYFKSDVLKEFITEQSVPEIAIQFANYCIHRKLMEKAEWHINHLSC